MLGAILGDIVGSTYEFANTKDYNFDLFPAGSIYTDDTVLTVAVADAILNKCDYGETIRKWALRYPHPKGAYGSSFTRWMHADEIKPYGSYGNGSAMRVSPGWLFIRSRLCSRGTQECCIPTIIPKVSRELRPRLSLSILPGRERETVYQAVHRC